MFSSSQIYSQLLIYSLIHFDVCPAAAPFLYSRFFFLQANSCRWNDFDVFISLNISASTPAECRHIELFMRLCSRCQTRMISFWWESVSSQCVPRERDAHSIPHATNPSAGIYLFIGTCDSRDTPLPPPPPTQSWQRWPDWPLSLCTVTADQWPNSRPWEATDSSLHSNESEKHREGWRKWRWRTNK